MKMTLGSVQIRSFIVDKLDQQATTALFCAIYMRK